jgi:hypothetical protein
MPEEALRDLHVPLGRAAPVAGAPTTFVMGRVSEVSDDGPIASSPSSTQKRREDFYKDCDLDSVRATQVRTKFQLILS